MSDPVSILLGIPCTQGGITEACLHSILELEKHCRSRGWDLRIEARSDGLVTRTRNIFASHVVRTPEYTHLLMIDSDMGFAPTVVERLVRSGHGVVGACVPLREIRWNRVRSMLDQLPDLTAEELASLAHGYAVRFDLTQGADRPYRPADGFLPATLVGGALLLIRREALVRLTESDLVDSYNRGGPWSDWEPSGWTFFDPLVNPDDRNYLSEDYAFCHRWRALGETVWVDLLSRVTHHGMVAVDGSPATTLRAAQRVADQQVAP